MPLVEQLCDGNLLIGALDRLGEHGRDGQVLDAGLGELLFAGILFASLGAVLDYVYDLPFLQLLNSNSLDIVIMQGLSGGIGVILTVPIAAGFSAVLLSRHRQQQADEPEQAKASQA